MNKVCLKLYRSNSILFLHRTHEMLIVCSALMKDIKKIVCGLLGRIYFLQSGLLFFCALPPFWWVVDHGFHFLTFNI